MPRMDGIEASGFLPSVIRRYIIWRNNHAYHERPRRIIAKAHVA